MFRMALAGIIKTIDRQVETTTRPKLMRSMLNTQLKWKHKITLETIRQNLGHNNTFTTRKTNRLKKQGQRQQLHSAQCLNLLCRSVKLQMPLQIVITYIWTKPHSLYAQSSMTGPWTSKIQGNLLHLRENTTPLLRLSDHSTHLQAKNRKFRIHLL
jgi:hypothetical protein